MSSTLIYLLAGALLSVIGVVFAFLTYVVIRYSPIIARVFEEKPLFFPLRLTPEPGGEDVIFPTADGLDLAGTYYRARTRSRSGVIVFCHEYLSNRWSFLPYAGPFLALGFDVLTFDFRNHGCSGIDPEYQPLQWVTDHEVNDVAAALAYVRSRPDHDPDGYGLFGVSRGGGAALVAASKDPRVWGVVTDGAFPTRGTMLTYILRWAEIYVAHNVFWKYMPLVVFRVVGWTGRMHSSRRLKCRFPDIEHAVARLSPRPWLMIHGEKDAYIVPAIARALFDEAGEPKEQWFVPKAKHNRCREIEPQTYADRVASFLGRSAPRKETAPTPAPVAVPEPLAFEQDAVAPDALPELPVASSITQSLAAQISG